MRNTQRKPAMSSPPDGVRLALKLLGKANTDASLLVAKLSWVIGIPERVPDGKLFTFTVDKKQYKGFLTTAQQAAVKGALPYAEKVRQVLLYLAIKHSTAAVDALKFLKDAFEPKSV